MFETIESLLPQRSPFRFVDGFLGVDLQGLGHAYYRVCADCVLLQNGRLTVGGLLEHMAQSVAVFSGYGALEESIEPSGAGVKYLAGADGFSIRRHPCVGERLDTRVQPMGSLGPIHQFAVTTYSYGDLVASVRLKVADGE